MIRLAGLNLWCIFVPTKQQQTLREMITTKRKYAGAYKVYRNGQYVGHIDKNGNERGEWVAFDSEGEYISHNDTKKFALMDFE